MSANVETMFYTRVVPWHGLGVCVENAVSSEEALKVSGLNWNVVQQSILTEEAVLIPGYKANIRDTDNKILGVVSDRYKVVQNAEAFAFTDALLGEGVTYETAGSLQDGKKSGCLQNCRKSILSAESRSSRISFSATLMMAAAR